MAILGHDAASNSKYLQASTRPADASYVTDMSTLLIEVCTTWTFNVVTQVNM